MRMQAATQTAKMMQKVTETEGKTKQMERKYRGEGRVDWGMKAEDEENERIRWNSPRMQALSFLFYESSLYPPSLSLFPSVHISPRFSPPPSLSPDAGKTKHFGETQLFYRWDQREIVCPCLYLNPCDFKTVVYLQSFWSGIISRISLGVHQIWVMGGSELPL